MAKAQPTLRPRQVEALALWAELGHGTAVAERMGISQQSLRNLLCDARKRLGGMRFTVEAVWVARGRGLI